MANVSFMTGGDVAPGRDSGCGMFGEIAARFRAADVSFLNLENALSDRGERQRGKPYYHRGNPAHVEALVEAGFTCMNVANNHMLDFGEPAMFHTLEQLEAKGIGHFGAGRNIAEARKACVVEKKGLTFGFLGYTTTLPAGFAATPTSAGVNPLQVHTAYQPKWNLLEYPGVAPAIVTWTEPAHLEALRSDVAQLAKTADIVILYVHWGSSMTPHVHDFQREIARAAIDAGAHGVFGGHQHVISAIEFYRGRPIVHCTGNLLFDKWEPFFTDDTLKTFLFGATADREGLRDCFLVPVKNGVNTAPRLLPRSDPLAQAIVSDVQAHSRRFGTRLLERDGVVEVRPE